MKMFLVVLAGLAVAAGLVTLFESRLGSWPGASWYFCAALGFFFGAALLDRLDQILVRMKTRGEVEQEAAAVSIAEQKQAEARLQAAQAATLLRKAGGDADVAEHLARKAGRFTSGGDS